MPTLRTALLALIGAAAVTLYLAHVITATRCQETGGLAVLRGQKLPRLAGGAGAAAIPATAAVTAPLAPEILGNLRLNEPARRLFGSLRPATTPVIHFTFGSGAMLDFLRNWLHYVRRAGLEPAVAGAADAQMLAACSKEGIAALGIVEGLDVWTYERSAAAKTVVQEGAAEWKYYRHHKSSFLELGLVKAAFLWELVSLGHALLLSRPRWRGHPGHVQPAALVGYDVLISDLDVVWLSAGWERWMTYRVPHSPPLREAELLAMADVPTAH